MQEKTLRGFGVQTQSNPLHPSSNPAERATEMSLKSRIGLGTSRRAAFATLTARELEIVTLAAEGLVNKEIADTLRITEPAVSTHLRRIFAKLGVDTPSAVVRRCFEDLAGPPAPREGARPPENGKGNRMPASAEPAPPGPPAPLKRRSGSPRRKR
jgi:DNA-binding CsgD family transcriptional regulator